VRLQVEDIDTNTVQPTPFAVLGRARKAIYVRSGLMGRVRRANWVLRPVGDCGQESTLSNPNSFPIPSATGELYDVVWNSNRLLDPCAVESDHDGCRA